jgi:hypothetical protein
MAGDETNSTWARCITSNGGIVETEVKQEEGKWKIRHDTSWKIKIPRCLYDKIFMYTKCIDKEIAGFGDVEVDDTNKLYCITSLMMFKQKVSGSSVDFSSEHLGEMLGEAMASGQDLSKTKFEWHSHVNMGVFWSATDEECCKTLVGCSRDFYLFFVVNKKGELLARVDYLVPFAGGTIQLTHLQIPVLIEEPVDNELETIVKADIAKYIEEPATHHNAWNSREYKAEHMCSRCRDVKKPARWDFGKKCYLCKECEEEKDKADTDIAVCPFCSQV